MLQVKWFREADQEMPGTYIAGGTCIWDDAQAHKRLLEHAYTDWFRRTA